MVEIATGLLFVLFYDLRMSWMSDIPRMSDIPISAFGAAFGFVTIPFLVVIFVYDLKHYIIPDKVIYPAIGVALIYDLRMFWMLDIRGMSDILISAFGAAAFFLAIVLISRGKWMGVGDIKLAFLMGLMLSYPNIIIALFLAMIIGAIIGVGLIILGKKGLKSEVPFGPFLVIGTFIALFWGKEIINWYVQSFFLN